MTKKNMKILLVEDDEDDYVITRNMISEINEKKFEMEWVSSFHEGVDSIWQSNYDVCLLDYRLGKHSGLELLQKVKAKHIDLPIIVLTGAGDREIDLQVMNEGAADFLVKGKFDASGLERTIRYAVAHKNSVKALRDAEKHLRDREAAFRLMFADNPLPMWVYDLETLKFLEVNERAISYYGYSREEFLRMFIEDIRPTEDKKKLRDHIKSERAALENSGHWRHLLKGGRVIDVEIISHTLMFGGRRAVLVVSQDITERKRMQEFLQESEKKYRSYFEEDLAGHYISSPDGTLLECNPAFLRIFSFPSVEEAKATNLGSLYRDPAERAHFLDLIRTNKKLEFHETEMTRLDGKTLYAVENVIGVFDDAGKLIQVRGFVFDDTRRRELEEQLIQSQKMESLGTLAGGIAHDFNNILSIIVGHAHLLDKERGSVKENVQTIVKSVHRGAALVRQLLTFARKEEVRLESILINDIISDVHSLLRETFPKTIRISLQLTTNLPPIVADSTQMHQVLLNLCVNARDAMPRGGMLTISTQLESGQSVSEKLHKALGRDFVHVIVSDTGTGMDEATKARIFEPFFTTKERDRGTGMGLATVYGIVEMHHGHIEVVSVLGKGTEFHLYFPVQPGFIESRISQETDEDIRGGTETILIIDDEDAIRAFMETVLSDAGYNVLTAKDADEAIGVYSEHADDISLVLSDIGLPKLNGPELFDALKEIRMDIKVVMASGYIEPQVKSEMFKKGIKDFIQKPYTANTLLKKIRDILDLQS